MIPHASLELTTGPVSIGLANAASKLTLFDRAGQGTSFDSGDQSCRVDLTSSAIRLATPGTYLVLFHAGFKGAGTDLVFQAHLNDAPQPKLLAVLNAAFGKLAHVSFSGILQLTEANRRSGQWAELTAWAGAYKAEGVVSDVNDFEVAHLMASRRGSPDPRRHGARRPRSSAGRPLHPPGVSGSVAGRMPARR